MPHDEFKVSNRRLQLLSVIVVMVAIVVIGRLYQKQIVEYPQYKAMAQKQHFSKDEIPSQRGKIFAYEEYGDPFALATNITKFQLWVIPRSVNDTKGLSETLAKLLNMSQAEIYKKINNKKYYVPPIKKKIDKKLANKINDMNLEGVLLVPESDRYYAEGDLAGQVLGYVDAMGIGRYGIEGEKDKDMQGKDGLEVAETDNLGRKISLDSRQINAKDGDDIVATIEHNVQYKAEDVLKKAVKEFDAKSGSIVVLDVKNGGVVAMANTPGYDPNNYGKVAQKNMDLFNNTSVCSAWEPGSIMKPLVMAAALDKGVIKVNTTGVFQSHVRVQNYNIWTALKTAYGRETMSQVLQNSDNVAMVWIAKKLGDEWMYRYLTALGFGTPTKIELQGEASGSLMKLEDWRDINRATIAFGQGISMTPLQLVTAYGAIANNGVLFKPKIISSVNKDGGQIIKIKKENVRRVFSKKTVKEITEMMVSVVELGHGKKAAVKGYKIAGKTGTAQVPKPGGGYYEDRNIGSFAGFFPADKPRFAMIVKIDYPKKTKWAESSAGPTFGEMAKWLLNYYRILPKGK